MKRFLAPLIALLLLTVAVPAQAASFTDTFTTGLRPVYHTCYPWGCHDPTNPGVNRYDASQVSVHNGLHLTAQRDGSGYVSGMVQTKGTVVFEYQSVTVTFSAPRGQGLWPAIWMLAENGQRYTELDGIEIVNGIGYAGVHYNDNGVHKHSGGSIGAIGPGSHTLTIHWHPNSITWALDGRVVRTETVYAHIPHVHMYLLMNLAVGGAWPGQPDATTPFPADFTINRVAIR